MTVAFTNSGIWKTAIFPPLYYFLYWWMPHREYFVQFGVLHFKKNVEKLDLGGEWLESGKQDLIGKAERLGLFSLKNRGEVVELKVWIGPQSTSCFQFFWWAELLLCLTWYVYTAQCRENRVSWDWANLGIWNDISMLIWCFTWAN